MTHYVQGTVRGGAEGSSATLPIIGGVVHPAATGPMWAGMAIQEVFLAPSPASTSAGRALQLATSVARVTGFTVANGSTALTRTLGSEVPMTWPAGSATAQGGPSINFVRLGSQVELVVQAKQDLAKSLTLNKLISTPVGWDFVNQRLIAGSAGNQLPVRVVEVTTLEGVTIVTDDTGCVVWESPSAAAVILL